MRYAILIENACGYNKGKRLQIVTTYTAGYTRCNVQTLSGKSVTWLLEKYVHEWKYMVIVPGKECLNSKLLKIVLDL